VSLLAAHLVRGMLLLLLASGAVREWCSDRDRDSERHIATHSIPWSE
jgi:hypothetical protein